MFFFYFFFSGCCCFSACTTSLPSAPLMFPSVPVHHQRNLTEYFVAVDVNNMLQLYASMLHERRIIITSSKLSTVSQNSCNSFSGLQSAIGCALWDAGRKHTHTQLRSDQIRSDPTSLGDVGCNSGVGLDVCQSKFSFVKYEDFVSASSRKSRLVCSHKKLQIRKCCWFTVTESRLWFSFSCHTQISNCAVKKVYSSMLGLFPWLNRILFINIQTGYHILRRFRWEYLSDMARERESFLASSLRDSAAVFMELWQAEKSSLKLDFVLRLIS